MPKRKTIIYDDDDGSKQDVPTDPAEESYSAFMAKWGRDGAKVRVYRMTPQGKQYCYLAAPEEVDPESIRLYHAKQELFRHEIGNYLVEVELNGEVRPPFSVVIAPQASAPGVPDSNGGGVMERMFQMLQQQNERLERQLTTQNREPIGQLADAMVKIDQLRGAGKSELPIDALMRAIELGKSMSGSDSDSWMSLIKEVAPMVAPALTQIAGSLMHRNGNAGALPAGSEPVMNDDDILKMGIDYLKKKALGGKDPGLYIDLVISDADDALYAKLIHRILNNDFPAFAAIDPEISQPQYEPFFRALYDGLRSYYTQQNPVESDTGGKSGNGGNIKPDGGTGKKRSK